MKDKEKDKDLVQKKIAFIILLVGFILSLVIGVIGGLKMFLTFADQMTTPQSNIEQTTSSFYTDGKLNFSNGTTYECQGSNCNWAYEMIDDVSYKMQYYNDGTINMFEGLIDDRYAFLVDGDNVGEEDTYYRGLGVKIYDTATSKVVDEYLAIKNYSKILYNKVYIVQAKTGKWGLINIIDGSATNVFEFKYDFIGVFARDNTVDISAVDKFVVLENGKWSILDISGNVVSGPFDDKIVGYEGSMVVLTDDTKVYVNIFNSNKYDYSSFKNVLFTNTEAVVLYNDTSLSVVSGLTGLELFTKIGDMRDVSVKEDGDKFKLLISGQEVYTG